jgi:hypothetical protein
MSEALQAKRVRVAATGLLMAVAIAVAGMAWTTNAEAACSGTNCLPASGYTFDTTWSCISAGGPCWVPGGSTHTYGWASASYSGGGSTAVLVGLLFGD